MRREIMFICMLSIVVSMFTNISQLFVIAMKAVIPILLVRKISSR